MRSFFEQVGGAQGALNKPERVSDDVVTVFGRHNPPHIGHKLTFDYANDVAQNIGDKAQADQKFYSSRSQDPKKNPLPFQQKLSFLRRMFPEHAGKWDDDENVRTVLGAAQKAYGQGYKNFHFVGGGDRKQGMEDLLRRYNGNLYNFDNIYSHSAGERDENDEGDNLLAQISASKQRGAAMGGDFDKFKKGLLLNKSFGEKDARELFDALRMYMVKNEAWEIAPRHNQDTIRELYRDGLYEVGDIVESLSYGLVGTVHRCGANHLICVTEDGIMFKNFIHDVQHLNY